MLLIFSHFHQSRGIQRALYYLQDQASPWTCALTLLLICRQFVKQQQWKWTQSNLNALYIATVIPPITKLSPISSSHTQGPRLWCTEIRGPHSDGAGYLSILNILSDHYLLRLPKVPQTNLVPRPPSFLPSVCVHIIHGSRKPAFFASHVLLWMQTGEAWEQGYLRQHSLLLKDIILFVRPQGLVKKDTAIQEAGASSVLTYRNKFSWL